MGHRMSALVMHDKQPNTTEPGSKSALESASQGGLAGKAGERALLQASFRVLRPSVHLAMSNVICQIGMLQNILHSFPPRRLADCGCRFCSVLHGDRS